MSRDRKLVLGSRSPRRRELLTSIVAEDSLTILPPASDEELSFRDLRKADDIATRLMTVVGHKYDDVCQQIASSHSELTDQIILCADTIVVASESHSECRVLGKPDPAHWQDDVRKWFHRYLSGRTHEVWTGYRLGRPKQTVDRIVKTKVTFDELSTEIIEWYISTEESRDKAGGYGIQSRAAGFVNSVDGSLSNVIGLPVFEITADLELTASSFEGDTQ